MANYPQLDNASGVWNLREVYDAVMGGYWPNANSTGLFFGGFSPSQISTIAKVNISSSGNATSFGNLSTNTGNGGACGSFTRAIYGGGVTPTSNPAAVDTIEYVQFVTEGNAADFGNLSQARERTTATSNSTRGLWFGGFDNPNYRNTIDYVTMDSLGNATDFGDLTTSRRSIAASASPTRAIMAGGDTGSTVNTIDFVEINTTGNAIDFGDLTKITMNAGGASSSTRYVCVGGNTPSPSSASFTTLEFVTIASQGNATDYGDLTVSRQTDCATNSVKSVNYAGYNNPAAEVNTIDIFTISTGGNATDFGDATIDNFRCRGASNSHGGLNDGYQGTRPLPYADNGDRAVFGAGTDPGLAEQVSFIKISSTGNDGIFGGYLNGAPGTGNYKYASAGGNTRGLGGGGYDDPGTVQSETKYLTFSTKGNMAVFGDLSVARQGSAACSNSIRSVVAGGSTPSRSNVIDYFTTASTGNAADFGNLNMGTSASLHMSGGDHNRGIFAGGNPAPGSLTNAIDYITFSTIGNSTDFGDLTVARSTGSFGQMCSATRSVFAGGLTPSASDVIDYVTTVTTGNASDFGNLAAATSNSAAASSTTRAVIAGGATPSIINTIQFVTIASTSNTSDFGDLSEARHQFSGMSDAHGGLQGG